MYTKTFYILFWILLLLIVTVVPYEILIYFPAEKASETDKGGSYYSILLQALALAYFLYQAYSGSFFATTSIFLDVVEDKNNHDLLYIMATIERGDKWLSEIKSVRYVVSEEDNKTPDEFEEHEWYLINFPKRNICNEKVFRLAPKEKTSAPFIARRPKNSRKGFYVIAEVKYESVGWRVSAISYAKIFIPPVNEPILPKSPFRKPLK